MMLVPHLSHWLFVFLLVLLLYLDQLNPLFCLGRYVFTFLLMFASIFAIMAPLLCLAFVAALSLATLVLTILFVLIAFRTGINMHYTTKIWLHGKSLGDKKRSIRNISWNDFNGDEFSWNFLSAFFFALATEEELKKVPAMYPILLCSVIQIFFLVQLIQILLEFIFKLAIGIIFRHLRCFCQLGNDSMMN